MSQMLSRAVVAAVCAVALASCGAQREPALPAAAPEALGLSPSALERMDPAIQAFVDSGHVGGVYAVIARHGRTGYERTFGWRDVGPRDPLRRDDVFRIYSMTKPVTAVGLLRLVDEGRVRLDDPVSRYIPAFAEIKVFAGGTAADPVLEEPASPITVRQLMNHTSGLAYGLTRSPVDTIFSAAELYDAGRTLEQFADSLARIPLLFHPGTAWSYSSGVDLVGRVIEVASGRPFDDFLEEEIFAPLGMRDTGFRIRPDMRDRLVTVYRAGEGGKIQQLGWDPLMAMFEPGARFLWGSGGLLSTPDDYLRFAQMLLNGGALGEVRILRPETVRSMTADTVPRRLPRLTGGLLNDSTYRFGLGVAVKVDTAGQRRPGPAGLFRWSGYLGTYFWIDPVNDLIAMVWTQLSPGSRYPIEETFQELVYGAVPESTRTGGRGGPPEVIAGEEWRAEPPVGHEAEALRRNLSPGDSLRFGELRIRVDAMISGEPAAAVLSLGRDGARTEMRVPAGAAIRWEGYRVAVLSAAPAGELGGGLVGLEVATLASLPPEVAGSDVAGGAEMRLLVPHRITHVTLHHIGSPQPLRPEDDPVERLRGLQRWGRTDRNWWDVPYHFLIDLEGRIYEGRDWRYMGETNTAYDPRGHLLISVIGNYDRQEATPAQVAAITELMAWGAAEFGVPLDRIGGHYDYAATSCPGAHLVRYLEDGTFRRGVAAALGTQTVRPVQPQRSLP